MFLFFIVKQPGDLYLFQFFKNNNNIDHELICVFVYLSIYNVCVSINIPGIFLDLVGLLKTNKKSPSDVVGGALAPLALPTKAESVVSITSQCSYSSTIVHVGDKKPQPESGTHTHTHKANKAIRSD